MGGPSQTSLQGQVNAANTQNQIAGENLNLEKQFLATGQQQLEKGNQLQQPAINFYSALASGSPTAALSASAPAIGNIANQTKQNQANIMNNVPAGAGRDYALANNQRQEGTDIAGFMNQAFLQAPGALAQLGSQAQGLGLQEQGAGLSSLGGAASATGSAANIFGNVAQQQNASKASTMGFLGQLAGAGASVATGGLSGAGGKASTPSSAGGNLSALPAVSQQQYSNSQAMNPIFSFGG